MELLQCSNRSSRTPATQWRSQPMASQSTEHSFITPRQELQTLVGDLSRRGGSESTASPQDSYGSHPSTTRCRSTADTSGRSWFRRFDTICASCSVLYTKTGRRCLLLGTGFAVVLSHGA